MRPRFPILFLAKVLFQHIAEPLNGCTYCITSIPLVPSSSPLPLLAATNCSSTAIAHHFT